MRILACDSGVERTGYALFDTQDRVMFLKTFDCLYTSKKDALSVRLHNLSLRFEELVSMFRPDTIVVEKLFFNTNQTTAIMVAQAQGLLLAVAGKHNIPVSFISPTQIKSVVTGYGRSDKKSVQKMLRLLLQLEEDPQPDDVADAIACGYAYCTMNKLI
ncbi:MAG: Crossover junction endodeoxyribonuclease RuvC [Microgenomates bacterium OLB23]|nr:MAG: Crossover junction endodeoxyribonuclease RuvC [Microgenomates bacterium OLB23]